MSYSITHLNVLYVLIGCRGTVLFSSLILVHFIFIRQYAVQRVKSHELDSNSSRHKYMVCSFPCWASRMPQASVLFPWQYCGEVQEGREPESVPAGSTSLTMLSCYDGLEPCMEDNLTYKSSDLPQLKWTVQFKYSLWWHTVNYVECFIF